MRQRDRRGHSSQVRVWGRAAAAVALGLTVAHCGKSTGGVDPKYGVAASPRVVAAGQPVPKGGGRYSVGRPYQIAGKTYVPQEDPNYRATGTASWYGEDFHGRKTANGEVFDMNSIAAAHPTLPLPSYVRVTNLRNKRSLVVRVNDRGPFHQGRVIDLSVRAAELLGFHRNGIAPVRVEYVGPASVDGSDDVKLAATLRNDGRPAPAPSSSPSREVMVASAETPRPEPRARPQTAERNFQREYFDPNPMVAPQPRAVTERPVEPERRPAVARAPLPVATPDNRSPAAAPRQGYALASSDSRPIPSPAPQPGGQSGSPVRMVWSEGPAPASFNSRFGPGAGGAASPSGSSAAYAPVRHDGAVVTGRGLY